MRGLCTTGGEAGNDALLHEPGDGADSRADESDSRLVAVPGLVVSGTELFTAFEDEEVIVAPITGGGRRYALRWMNLSAAAAAGGKFSGDAGSPSTEQRRLAKVADVGVEYTCGAATAMAAPEVTEGGKSVEFRCMNLRAAAAAGDGRMSDPGVGRESGDSEGDESEGDDDSGECKAIH